MVTESGRVVAVETDSVWVETLQQSTCNSCAVQKGCGQSLLNKWHAGRPNHIRVLLRDQRASTYVIGDRVDIAVPDEVILKGSLIVYILPLIGLLLGAGSAAALVAGSEFAAILGAMIGFLAGACLVRWHGRISRDDPALQPQLLGHSAGLRRPVDTAPVSLP